MRRTDRPRAGLGWALGVLLVVLYPAAADAGLTFRVDPAKTIGNNESADFIVYLDSAPGDPTVNVVGFTARLLVTGNPPAVGFTEGMMPTTDYLFPDNTGFFYSVGLGGVKPSDPLPPGPLYPSITLADIAEGSPVAFPGGSERRLGIVTVENGSGATGTFSLSFDPDFTFVEFGPPTVVPAPPAAGLLLLGVACLPVARRLGLRR